MRRFPSNSSYVFEVVGFGVLCGAIHSTLCVNKHPTYMSLIGEDLLFSLKIHISFFDHKKMKIFFYSYLPTFKKYPIINAQNIPWCNSLSAQLWGILPWTLRVLT